MMVPLAAKLSMLSDGLVKLPLSPMTASESELVVP
jgi:hypothetical protein